ncbi:MAG: hypothetical protein EOM28_04540 [Clostridia bacterium]|nr:hypothetical protein [Clostridia bacterium]
MKKSVIAIVIMLALSLCLSACGKKANPIVLPQASEITSIEIGGGVQDIICTNKEQIESFVQKVSEATPTSKKSVQDVPTVEEYIRIDFVTNGNIASVFIYQEGSNWYIEQPYQGIYETDETILTLLENEC